MNSRQRRKEAAEQHNALLIENQAYCEDQARDPAKYKVVRTNRAKAGRLMAAKMMMLGCYTVESGRVIK